MENEIAREIANTNTKSVWLVHNKMHNKST